MLYIRNLAAIALRLLTVGLSFTIGVFIGSYSRILWYGLLVEYTPNLQFLSGIITFDSAAIAILIPLSIQITSRMSERYESEVVLRPFEQEWENRWLIPLLVIDVTTAVTLQFFLTPAPHLAIWKIFSWGAFLLFVFNALVILSLIGKLRRYLIEPDFVVEKLFENVKDLLE